MTDVRPVTPDAVRWIVRKLEDAGYETWTVGGAIRDAVRGQPSGDWDLATRATPKQMRRTFRRTVPIGIDHGTVGILARDDTMYEVTTFRKDVETDGRHAVVRFAQTIEEDLARRDFTINAIAWHPLREELLDPFEGVADLRDRVLRTVGSPAERFREDYLRILRAFRFASRFEMKIEKESWRAVRDLVDHLTALSQERVREELLKILDVDRTPSRALGLYQESGAMRVLYGEVNAIDAAAREGAFQAIDRLPTGRPLLRLAALLRPLNNDAAAAVLLRLRLSNAAVDETARLAQAEALPAPTAADADFRRWLSRNGEERLHPVARLLLAAARVGAPGSNAPDQVIGSWRRGRAVRRTSPPLTVSDLEMDGRGLIGMGMRPGPHFGDILEHLLEWVLDDPARNRRDTLERRAATVAKELGVPGASEKEG